MEAASLRMKEMPVWGLYPHGTGGQVWPNTHAAAATIGGVTPRRGQTGQFPTPSSSHSTTLSACTSMSWIPEWARSDRIVAPPQGTTLVQKGGLAAQDIRFAERHEGDTRSRSGMYRTERQQEILLKRKAIYEMEMELLQLEEMQIKARMQTATRYCTAGSHGEELRPREPPVQLSGIEHGRDEVAAYEQWRYAIDHNRRRTAMADTSTTPAMAYSYRSPENHATEKGHAPGTAPTAPFGSTAPTNNASNTGLTAYSTHTTLYSQTAATRHCLKPEIIPHQKEEEQLDWATSARLREATVFLQSRFRANRLMERQKAEFRRQKFAATVIQQWFRGHRAMIEARDRFIALRQAAVTIQQCFRAYAAVVQAKGQYLQLREATISIQAHWRSTIAMRKQRAIYLRKIGAIRTIQMHYWRFRAQSTNCAAHPTIPALAATRNVERRQERWHTAYHRIRYQAMQAVDERVKINMMLVVAELREWYGTVILQLVSDYCGAVLPASFRERRHIQPFHTHNERTAPESIDCRQHERNAQRLRSWFHGGNHRKRFFALLLSEVSSRTPTMTEDPSKDSQLWSSAVTVAVAIESSFDVVVVRPIP